MALATTFSRFHLNHAQGDAAVAAAEDARAAAGASLWRRLLEAMMEARQRQAEREIAYHLRHMEVLTDDVERRMTDALKGRPLI